MVCLCSVLPLCFTEGTYTAFAYMLYFLSVPAWHNLYFGMYSCVLLCSVFKPGTLKSLSPQPLLCIPVGRIWDWRTWELPFVLERSISPAQSLDCELPFT